MRVGLIGAGKRMTNTYVPILRALGEEIVGFVTRTPETATKFEAATGVKSKGSLGELYKENPDYFIVCVIPSATSAVTRSVLKSGCPILIETPIEDMTLLEAATATHASVGVLEQWPYLPLEQFKALLYDKKLLKRPFLVKNDGRSYDYHAIAQLRTYIGREALPVTVRGSKVSMPLDEFEGADGEIKRLVDAWDIAHIEFDNGAVLCHEFSYACKVAPFRSIQSLRAYSTDGTIVTGRIWNRDNDYEIIDIETIIDKSVKRLDVELIPGDHGGIASISVDGAEWVNPFAHLDLNDSSVAIATHIAHMKHVVQNGVEPLYNLRSATMDQYLMYAIKQACGTGNALRLKQ